MKTPINTAKTDGSFVFPLLVLLALPNASLPSPVLTFETQLTPVETISAPMFGSAVAIDNDTLLVGAVLADEKDRDSGSVSLFARTTSGWRLHQTLTASDGSGNDHFGRAVAIDGNTLVVGASEADVPGASLAGAAYVFVWNGARWSEQAKLSANDASPGQEFGNSVAISGDTIAVGAPKDKTHGPGSGAVYIFVRNGPNWNPQTKLTLGDDSSGAGFGYSVGMSGDTLVASAHGLLPQFVRHVPAAYVFARTGTSWSQQAKLTDDPIVPAFDRAFGVAVAIHVDTIAVGDKLDDGRSTDSGSVSVFVRSGTTWTLQQKLTASDATEGDLLGGSIAIDGDTIVAGAPRKSDSGSASGAVYLFTRSGPAWSQFQKLTAAKGGTGDNFGSVVDVSGAQVVVGAPFKDTDVGADFGAAYVYEPEPPPAVAVVATDSRTSEGGPAPGTFLIGRAGDKSKPLTVSFTLAGTASSGRDFQSIGNSATILADGSWVQVSVVPIDDAEVEGSETVVLTLIPGAAYTIDSPGAATVTIEDNDRLPPPTVTVETRDGFAAENGLDSGAFRIERFGDTGEPLTVCYSLSGTASNAEDYQRLDQSVTISAGQTTADLMIQPINDSEEEGSETVVLTLTPNTAYTVASRNIAFISIEDNDERPPPPPTPTVTVVASDPDASEGRSDPGAFALNRTGDAGDPLTVFFAPFSGTASNGRDFQTLADFAVFPAGVTSVSLVVQPIDDTELEGSESVVLTLAARAGYTVGTSNTASITITDNHQLAPTFPALTRETELPVEAPLPLAISGTTLVIGGHLFVRGPTGWSEQQTLPNANAAAIENDTLALGSNSTTVYARTGTAWAVQQMLSVMATSLAISGDTLAIGVEDDSTRGTQAGALYVFVRNGTVWTQQAKLTANDAVAGAGLGYSVSLSGHTLVAGAPGRTVDFAGQTPAAYVFVRDGTTWSQQAKLTGNPGEIGPGQNFGLSVGISGNTILVGDPNDDGRGQDAGAVMVFERDGSTWTRRQIITASDGSAGDFFGWSIAIKGESAAVGAPRDSFDRGNQAGSAYVFTRDGTTWSLLQKLTAGDAAASDNFGTPLAIDDDAVAIGSYGGFVGSSSNARSVYLFEAPPNTAPTVACPSPITLNCSPSSGLETDVSVQVGDGEGDGLTVSWSMDGANVQTDSVPSSRPPRPAQLTFRRVFTRGTHTVRVTASDGRASATCETVVTIGADTTAPVISCPADMVVAAAPGQTSAVVNYRVLATDNCSSVTLASNPRSGSAFPLGTTTVTTTATDATGNQSTCSFRVTVREPELSARFSLRADPSVLWPPNGKMVPVTINVSAGTNFVASSFRIVSVRSNESVKAQGKGNKGNPPGRGQDHPRGKDDDDDSDNESPSRDDDEQGGKGESKDGTDWEITGALTLKLRAERLGTGGGRVYTITVEGRAVAGQRLTKEVTVTVPHHPTPSRPHGYKSDSFDRSS